MRRLLAAASLAVTALASSGCAGNCWASTCGCLSQCLVDGAPCINGGLACCGGLVGQAAAASPDAVEVAAPAPTTAPMRY